MKFSESWLREWVNPDIATDTLVEQLTMAGLEVDAVEAVAGDFSKVIVGEIVAIEQHPDADKLRVCQVRGAEDGDKQVVCGAPNARLGLKAPFAQVGAKLPGDFKIKKAKLRGVESLGMLCGQTELEAGDDDTGLWELPVDAPVGVDLREFLKLDDKVIDVDLTPNRSDCLGLKGLAREVGVLNKKDVFGPTINVQEEAIADALSVTLDASDGCPCYLGRVIKGVNVAASSPQWLVEKLRRSGIRSIDPIVDVTNYVLLELGQPMHAFDLAKLSGGISVRMASEKESLELLNEQSVELRSDTLVIADQQSALAIAGVMGGQNSAVSNTTQDIFLESAFFSPEAIAGKARSYGLHTDSSHRFERGVDPKLCVEAMHRASALILEICGGSLGPITEARAESYHLKERSVSLRPSRISSKLGFAIPEQESKEILHRLGFELMSESADAWEFRVPSYRFDVSIEEDLHEELARIYGYNNLPTTQMLGEIKLAEAPEGKGHWFDLAKPLLARDYQEVITYSFIEPSINAFFSAGQAVEVLNPISADMSVMRESLLPGLLQSLQHNSKRQQLRIRLFERGLAFGHSDSEGEYPQTEHLAGLIYGPRANEAWTGSRDWVDFYDLKGDLEALLKGVPGDLNFLPETQISYLHPGQAAKVLLDDEEVGLIGALHPSVQKSLAIKKPVYVFELRLDKLTARKVPAYSPISRQPLVNRDLAFVLGKDIPAAALEKSVQKAAGEILKQLKVFDIYCGEGIDSERKSVAFSLTFQHSSRTLNEEEINAAIDAIKACLEDEFNAKLR
jgi:phenylalanyl-tRNA synthetase beta chain